MIHIVCMGNNRINITMIKDVIIPINIKDMMLAHFKEIMKAQLKKGSIHKNKGQLDFILQQIM